MTCRKSAGTNGCGVSVLMSQMSVGTAVNYSEEDSVLMLQMSVTRKAEDGTAVNYSEEDSEA